MDWEAVVGAGRLQLVDLGDDVKLLKQRKVMNATKRIQEGGWFVLMMAPVLHQVHYNNGRQ